MKESLKEQLEKLAQMKDEDIDTSDIPETDESWWAGAQRGRFARQGDDHATRGPKDT
jgi:hypothetical protein